MAEAGFQSYLAVGACIVAARTFCKTQSPEMGSHTMKARLGPRPRAPPVAAFPANRSSAVKKEDSRAVYPGARSC
jgi:hypothetical protein